MYKDETITFDSGWKRIKLEFIDKIENNLETYDLNNKEDKLIKLKPNEYITYYKLVYDMCTQKDSNYSEMLYNHLGQALIEFINNKMCNNLQQYKEDDNELVELIYQYWVKYKSYINVLKGIFSYLDRFYVQLALQPTIYEYAMAIFQKHIFEPYKGNIKRYLLDSLDGKRTGDNVNNLHILAIVEMYNKLDSTLGLQYKEDLEPLILERCSTYYNKIAPIWINDLSLLDYIYIIQYCIDDELDYCNKYLNKNTSELIYNTILASLLYNQQDKINTKFNELSTLFETYQINDLKLIYKLTNKLSNINEQISKELKEYILKNIKEDDVDYMIELYNKYLYLIQSAFDNNNYILNVYNSVFKNHINTYEFISQLLSHFNKYMISTTFDHDQQHSVYHHKDGNGDEHVQNVHHFPGTNDDDKKDKIDDYVNIYNLLDDKNEFITNYKMNLCYRLLDDKSDIEDETRVLNKLSHDDPNMNYLYKMIDDVKKSNRLYMKYVSNKDVNMSVDRYEGLKEADQESEKEVTELDQPLKNRVIAVCNIYWPISTNGYENVNVNEVFAQKLEEFQEYYKENNKFKRFQYSYEYSPVDLVYEYKRAGNDSEASVETWAEKKIRCNMLQATLILMFNRVEKIKTDQILSEMNIKYEELIRVIESSQDFFTYDDDALSINYNYLHSKNEINLMNSIYNPLLSVKNHGKVKHMETLMENYNCIDSLIVKIMKKYKKLNQNNLLNIVNTHLSNLNININYTEQIIMDRLKNLITKEYIEQVDDQLLYIP